MACDLTLSPRNLHPDERYQVHWWNDEITDARAEYVRHGRTVIWLSGWIDVDAADIMGEAYQSVGQFMKCRILELKESC